MPGINRGAPGPKPKPKSRPGSINSNPHEVTRELIGSDSLEWETMEGWPHWVVQPVYKYPMAPRWALAILIKSGQLFSRGVGINRILEKLNEI